MVLLCSTCGYAEQEARWGGGGGEGRLPNTEQSTADTIESKITWLAVAKVKGGLQAGLQRHHNAMVMKSADVPPSQAEFCSLT